MRIYKNVLWTCCVMGISHRFFLNVGDINIWVNYNDLTSRPHWKSWWMLEKSSPNGLNSGLWNMIIYPNVCYIWQHGSHQYTPFMLASIPAPWILWVLGIITIHEMGKSVLNQPIWVKDYMSGLAASAQVSDCWFCIPAHYVPLYSTMWGPQDS